VLSILLACNHFFKADLPILAIKPVPAPTTPGFYVRIPLTDRVFNLLKTIFKGAGFFI
jgi:hypothetical protein